MKLSVTSKQKRVILVSGILLLLLLGSFLFGWFGYTSVCTRCGAEKYSRDMQLPMTRLTVWSSSTIKATTFSTALFAAAPDTTCPHEWMFAAGGGNGVKCAIGSGRHLWTTISSTNVATLLVWNQKYGDPQFQDRFVRVALDPDTHAVAEMMAFDIPDNGFASRDEYHVWLAEAQKFFEEQVTRSKESRLRY